MDRLVEQVAETLNGKVERWLDGEEGIATFADLLSAALEECGATIDPGWRPIETAPLDGTPVLISNARTSEPDLCNCRWAVFDEGCWRDGKASVGGQRAGVPCPTHWRPLPSPPK